MVGSKLRALTALAVVLLASASAYAQDAQQQANTVASTAPYTSPLPAPTPAAPELVVTPAPAAPAAPAAAPTPAAATPAVPAAQTPAAPAAAPASPPSDPESVVDSNVVVNGTSPASSPAPEDPCKVIPGCSACIATTPSRKLMQMPAMTGTTAAGKPTLDWNAIVKSPYDQPNLPKCTVCSGEGYLQGTSGRCNCAAGYGDLYPTGHCNICPAGFISRGGFRAVCEECTDVAWSNEEHTMCICASGWYGYTNTVSRQATCNQCPGTRPVSKDGSRSAAECSACPAGQKPNEIFSECVTADPADATPAPPSTIGDLIGSGTSPSPAPAPPAPPLYNSSTFTDAKQDWQIHTRASQNITNPITDLIGSVVENMIMGRNISSTAQQPGDLVYQMLSKPPPSAQKALENLQNIAALGAGLGAAAGALPALAKAVGTDTPLGGLLNGVAQGMGGLASNMRQAAPGIPQTPADGANGNLQMLTNIIGQVLKTPSGGAAGAGQPNPLEMLGQVLKATSGGAAGAGSSSQSNPLEMLGQVLKATSGGSSGPGSSSQGNPLEALKTMANLAKLANAFKPATPAPVAAAAVTPVSIASTVAQVAKFMDVPKTAGGFVKVPSAPPKVTSAVNPLKLLAKSG